MKKLMIAAACALTLWSSPAAAQFPDFTPQTPLIGALLHDDLTEAKRLLDAGADPNEGRFLSMPAIFLAILREDLNLVRAMADKGADLSVRDRFGTTALMWAAFNEHGNAAVVEELLARGADPLAANQTGETALVWALRRGETPVTAALRKAGASDTALLKSSVEKAVALLQRSGAEFTRLSGCASCHHQALPQMALGVARTRGLHVDEEASRQQTESTIGALKRVYEQAMKNRDRIPDPPISVSYLLLGLSAANHPADEITSGMVTVIGAWQGHDGAFHPLPAMRPPIESNAFAATALSVRAIQIYGVDQEEQVARASRWLRTATPRTTEERAMQLLGLAWSKAPADDIRRSIQALLTDQRPDGGWAQLPTLETDAYATGQALVALQTAGYSLTSVEGRRGISFLLRTQLADGSWLVRSRTFPLQPLRDSGFPHGKDQWVSAAGTSWATMALALAIPPDATAGTR